MDKIIDMHIEKKTKLVVLVGDDEDGWIYGTIVARDEGYIEVQQTSADSSTVYTFIIPIDKIKFLRTHKRCVRDVKRESE